MTNRSPTFEEGSQSTTISSLSEKSKEETGISLQVNILDPIINNICSILGIIILLQRLHRLDLSFSFQTKVNFWTESHIHKFMVGA